MKRKIEYFVDPKDLSHESLITCSKTEAKEYYSKVGGSLSGHASMLFTKDDVEYLRKVYTRPLLMDNLICILVHYENFENDYCLNYEVQKDVKAVQEILEGDCESIELRFVWFLRENESL